MRLLRWSAALAVAETYQLEGFDAVVAEDALGDRLEDFLDLVEPEPVHVVVIRDDADPATPRWGLWVEGTDVGSDADGVAAEVVAHLDESRVLTTPPPDSHPRPPTQTPHGNRKSTPSASRRTECSFDRRGWSCRSEEGAHEGLAGPDDALVRHAHDLEELDEVLTRPCCGRRRP